MFSMLVKAINMIPMHHLAFLVLAAVPFSFSGVTIKRSDVPPASASLLNSAGVSLATPSSIPAGPQAAPLSSHSAAAAQSATVPNSQSNSIILAPTHSTSRPTPTIISESMYTALFPHSPALNHSFSTVPEIGNQFGRAVIRNNCNETFYIWSVGAWRLNGVRNDTIGYSANEEQKKHLVAPNTSYAEPFRVTCPPTRNGTTGYCHDYDKLRGQGVALKVSRSESLDADILQFEYALTMNPNNNDTYHKLHYDVSLLDCADPNKVPSLNGTQTIHITDPKWRNITDLSATADDHKKKFERCPGYRNGIKVTFETDPKAIKCKPVDCNGEKLCAQMYYYDRTRKDEPSMSCSAEYKGDMILDLCVGKKMAERKAGQT